MPEIGDWLKTLGMSEYAERFAENGIDISVLQHLTDQDLKDIGVLLGHRRKMLAAIAELARTAPVPQQPALAEARPENVAERRHLTVLFCDLVGSTALSSRLDPEDMRQVMRRYQDTVSGVVARFDGYVANFLGDGIVAYFGWPRAQEDQAAQAVRAGLAAVAAARDLRTPDDQPLAARVGLASGMVVVGDLESEVARQSGAISGETPNLAARLQAEAAPGEVVIGGLIRRLLGAQFELDDLGERSLKGLPAPVPVWRVNREATVESRFETTHAGPLTTLVGREHELGLLSDRWEMARDGEGQVVLLAGEAGIGKSRLCRAFRDQLQLEPHTSLRYQCSPHHTNSPLYPSIQQLGWAAGFAVDDSADEKLDKLEALIEQAVTSVRTAAPLLANLLSLPGDARYGKLDLTPQEIKQRTLAALCDQLIQLSTKRPVLFIVEDGHWIDPSSAELLDLVVEQIKACCVLVLVTHRPEWQPSFSSRSHVATLQLSRLGRRQGEDLIRSIAGRLIADEVLSEIVQRTDGVPLFIEEVTKSLVETGLDLAKVNIPATLHASLLARIDRLGPDAKAVAQVGAVIGRQFPYSLVSSATDLAEDLIKNALDRLVRSELVFRGGAPPDAIYTFKHALVQDAAYQSLLKSSRQQHHARIARVFEEVFPGTTENEPELLAHHFTEAGLAEPAVDNWLKAGRRAMQRSANVEAEQHLRSGLALLKIMPIGAERRRREIALQNTLGVCLMPTRGFGNAEIREAFTTAAMISEEEGDTRGLFVALRGKGQYQMISGDLPTAREQAGRILELAKTANDAGFLIEAHHLAWSALTFAGDLDAARRHAEAGIALYDREQHHGLTYIYSGHDPGVCCRSFGALATWQLGFPDRGLAQSLDGLALARELTHPFSVTIALWGIGILYLLRRDSRATHETGQMLLDYSVEKGIPPFVPMGKIYRGGALAEEGMFTEGLRELREGIAGVRKLGTEYTVPTYLAWLAELCAKSGLVAEGLQALEEGLTMAQKNQDFFSLPEFHRIRGELLLMESANSIAKVEACLEEGIGMARRLGAKSLELRAVTRLAQLWGECGKRTEARHLLAPVYGWFTEGVGTLDLKNAKALLHELA